MSLWSGRIEGASDPVFREINDSLAIDWRLVEHDIDASIAWAGALGDVGALSESEVDRLRRALIDLRAEARSNPAQPLETGAEDVHTWVELRLVDRLGDLGKKLHFSRSRNDQVATDLRLYALRALRRLEREVHGAQSALLDFADRAGEIAIPGYTHLQRAQPVLLAHWALAHVEALDRDAARLVGARARADECPLGCAALAGAAAPIDRERLARELGFARPSRNSIDAIAARDFVAESLAACALCAANLSRLAEDLILYASEEFGFVTLADDFASGSSIMPQKKNPDALELIRAKAGRLLGVSTGFLAVLKALPSAYNKDLQEDKRALFDAVDDLSLCLRAAAGVVATLAIDEPRCQAAAADPALLATELADGLAERGVPFRDAHESVGKAVRLALSRGVSLAELSIDDLRALEARFQPADLERLSLDAALRRRRALGGTAPDRVRDALFAARTRLQNAIRALDALESAQPLSRGARLRAARLAEVGALCDLINYWADRGRTMRREPDELAFSLRDFVVAERSSGELIGCGALRLTNGGLAEVCSVAVHPDQIRAGVGAAIVRDLQRIARDIGAATLFLATDTPAFFATLGFTPVNRSFIPDEAWTHPVLKTPRKADTVMIWHPTNGA